MEGLPVQNRIVIAEDGLMKTRGSIYELVIKNRVLENVGDDSSEKSILEDICKFEKIKDEYNKILEELKTESENELQKQLPAGETEK